MKCEHCGRNDATFYYRESVNGRMSETHLCEDCAAALGYHTGIGSAWDDLFSMLPRAVGAERFFAPSFTPAARRVLTVLPEQEQEKPLLSQEEQQKMRREREQNALRVALQAAIESEDYERAAKLRDELKRLEN